jgi:hypothetical protein
VFENYFGIAPAFEEKVEKPTIERKDSRHSLDSDNEEIAEVDMGKDENLKMPLLDEIKEEGDQEEVSKGQQDGKKESQDPDDSQPFDSFIVSTDYFGENQEKKGFDVSLDMTKIGSDGRSSDVSGLLSHKNFSQTHD